MNKAIISLTLFLTAAAPASAYEPVLSTERMVSDCEEWLNGKASSAQVEMPGGPALSYLSGVSAGTCYGAFQGLIQTLAATPLKDACDPIKDLRTLVQMFVVYAKSSPDRKKEPFISVVFSAMSRGYLCK